MKTFFLLLIGDALADFSFQSDAMAKGKNRNRSIDMSVVPAGQKYQVNWFYWLSAHALIHGGMVYLVTQRIDLALFETLCHWCIDFGKCENWYGIHLDQSAHIFCKFLWSIL